MSNSESEGVLSLFVRRGLQELHYIASRVHDRIHRADVGPRETRYPSATWPGQAPQEMTLDTTQQESSSSLEWIDPGHFASSDRQVVTANSLGDGGMLHL